MERNTSKVVLGGGIAASLCVALTYGVAKLLFSGALDAQWKHSKLRSPGERPESGPRLDAEEEAAAADWFDQSKQPVVVSAEDDIQLHGWLFDPDCVDAKPHLYAICCHGYAGEPADMAKYAHRFARMGFTVLTPSMRAHGLSEGRYAGMGWLDRRDLMRWISLIVDSDPQARILLQGRSMGAAAVMMTVGEPDLPRNVKAAVEDCGYASVDRQFVDVLRSSFHLPRILAVPIVNTMSLICERHAGYGFAQASCLEQLHHATVPMLFIHGGDDDFVPPRALDENFDACASIDRQKLLIPSAGHSMCASTAPIVYWKTIGNFVNRIFHLND
ncbi:alpha/beta hydrolase [Bifidobacterium leontopitheci]|uniref:Alpha/beta hydrolase n=1 Tax=Bifidobacterium leontopitheci TaxID=2650774 RepID=A0A6I1GKG5_9BIFI|nr:alpha/beta hydrolase [Bifidobacterium leontopitheci]KAB7791262.1 alpha/beta hydrolase [Bifidobacterium leontopitheci]